jgi:hypothetical protein
MFIFDSEKIYITHARLNHIGNTSTFKVQFWILVQAGWNILSHLENETVSCTAEYM